MRCDEAVSQTKTCLLMLAVAFVAPLVRAQVKTADVKAAEPPARSYQTLYLTNVSQTSDANEIVTDLRNMLPQAKLYYVGSQNAISMLGTSDDFVLAQKILADMDRSRKTYRVTYTITEMDRGQRVGTRRVMLIVASGGRADLKQGSRIPIVTGSAQEGRTAPSTQVQYQDVGLTIEASLDGPPDDLRLRTRVAQSNVAEERSGLGLQDPVLRQTTLEGMSMVAPGKPLVLGSLDVPGSTRHEEIAVATEQVQ